MYDPDEALSEAVVRTREDPKLTAKLKADELEDRWAIQKMHTLLSGPNPDKESSMQRAVREELVRALEQPLTIATLHKMSRIIQGAQILAGPRGVHGNGMMIGSAYPSVQMGGSASLSSSEDDSWVDAQPIGAPQTVMAPAPGQENFGSNFMREMVAALSSAVKPKTEPQMPDAYSLTLAIRNAKDLGLVDVAEKLTAQLREQVLTPTTEQP
jgi:hypothetical protein